MYGVTPIGYPAGEKSGVDIKLREQVKGDERLPAWSLFFDRSFSTPLSMNDQKLSDILKTVRWAPSAANMRPWRIVKDGDKFHFYERHTKQYDAENYGDVQKLDMWIALCHFMSVTDGKLTISDPDLDTPENTEYIATVCIGIAAQIGR